MTLEQTIKKHSNSSLEETAGLIHYTIHSQSLVSKFANITQIKKNFSTETCGYGALSF